jgi:hypothetical protein
MQTHISVRLDKNCKILNPYSDNHPRADESLIRHVQNPDERKLPHPPERARLRNIGAVDLRLDKKNFVLATDSYVIYPKDQCLYYWFGKNHVVACAVHPDLQNKLLTPLSQKQRRLKYTFHMTRKFVTFDGETTELVDYLGDFTENPYVDQILRIDVNGRPINHHGAYEMRLRNGSIEGYEERDKEKTDIRYTDEKDARSKIKEGGVVFDFLYRYDRKIT